MKLNKTTWLSLLLAVILGGGVFGYETLTQQKSPRADETQSQQWFQFQEADIQQIIIDRPGSTLRLLKTKDKTNPWQLKQPQNVPADTGTVAFLLNLLVSGKPQRTFTISAERQAQYGLDKPIATVTFVSGKKNEQIILGQPGIDEETIYAKVVSSSTNKSENQIILVSKNWQYAVERELEAWKQSALAK